MAFVILSALAFSKVSHRRILSHYDSSSIESAIKPVEGCLGLFLSDKLGINVAYHMITDVISDNEVLNLSKLCKLHEDLLEEIFKVVDCFNQGILWNIQAVCESDCCRGIFIKMRQGQSLRKRWLVMNTGACVSVAASSNLVVERTIDSKKGINTFT